MAKAIASVQLGIARLGVICSDISNDAELGKWLRKFHRALALSDYSIESYAAELLNDVEEYRESERIRKIPKDSTGKTRNPPDSGTQTDRQTDNKKEKSIFEDARKSYPGNKNGSEREWANFYAKNKNGAAEIVLKIGPAIEAEKRFKASQKAKGEFVPQWANFQTWINQERWEQEFSTGTPAVFELPSEASKRRFNEAHI